MDPIVVRIYDRSVQLTAEPLRGFEIQRLIWFNNSTYTRTLPLFYDKLAESLRGGIPTWFLIGPEGEPDAIEIMRNAVEGLSYSPSLCLVTEEILDKDLRAVLGQKLSLAIVLAGQDQPDGKTSISYRQTIREVLQEQEYLIASLK